MYLPPIADYTVCFKGHHFKYFVHKSVPVLHSMKKASQKNKFIYCSSTVCTIRNFKSVNSYKRMHRTLEQICSKWFNPSSLACVALHMLIRSVWLRNRISLSITPTLRLYYVCTLNPILNPIWMTLRLCARQGWFLENKLENIEFCLINTSSN